MPDPTSQPQPTDVTPTPTPAPVAAPRPLIFRLLGWNRRDGRWLRVWPNRWGWTVLVLVVLAAGGGAFAEYSMQPDFCNSCHIMQPYVKAWHDSSHKDIPCVKCHFEPGVLSTMVGKFQASSQAVKYITQTYGSKPHAEVRDSSCMREECHSRRVLEGRVDWTVPTQRGGKVTIKFDHTPHLTMERRGKNLRCVSCHSQIVQGKHLVVTLDTCFLCHFKGFEHGRHDETLGGCKNCHEDPKTEIRLATGVFKHEEYSGKGVGCENCHSDAVKGDGAVPKQVCWTCHNQPSQIAKYGETRHLHDEHVTNHKVECSSCHVEIEHSLTAGAGWKPAQASKSHNGGEGGSCRQCHEQTHGGPAGLYEGKGGRGVPDMPSPMYRAQVDCIACHKAKKSPDVVATVVGQTFMAVQDSCNECHGAKYDGALDKWRDNVATHLERAEIAHAEAKQAVDRAHLKGTDLLKARRLLDDASHNIRLVKLGHGVHNVNYSTALLNASIEWCADVQAITANHPAGGAQ